MLTHYGLTIPESLVLDPLNEPFPVPVVRQVGEFQVQEVQQVPYPFFVDIRPDGMAKGHPIVSNLQAVTLNWASPIEVDPVKNAEREVDVLLQSSAGSWVQQDYNIQPDFDALSRLWFRQFWGDTPVHSGCCRQGYVRELLQRETQSPGIDPGMKPRKDPQPQPLGVPGTIDASPATSRLVLIGSLEFVDDTILELSASMGTERYLNNLALVQNAVAWSVEDVDLLSISARGTAARLLSEKLAENPQLQSFWEVTNYVVALVALVVVGGFSGYNRRNEQPLALIPQT